MSDPMLQLSDFGESAVSDIRLIAHDYLVGHRSDTWIVGNAGRFGGPGADFGDRATQLAIANIVGIVEQYAENVLLAVGSNPGSIRSWPNKVKVWNNRYGSDIEKSCPSYQSMWGFYEARNAIMHRRGELTHSQRNQSVYDRLKAAGVVRVGYDIVVTAAAVSLCSAVCVRCVQELEGTRT